jgi:hypothetical protein
MRDIRKSVFRQYLQGFALDGKVGFAVHEDGFHRFGSEEALVLDGLTRKNIRIKQW